MDRLKVSRSRQDKARYEKMVKLECEVSLSHVAGALSIETVETYAGVQNTTGAADPYLAATAPLAEESIRFIRITEQPNQRSKGLGGERIYVQTEEGDMLLPPQTWVIWRLRQQPRTSEPA
jgi:hypothetical protein